MTTKNRSKKGDGNPVTEQPLHVEADPNGTRKQRRLWKKLHGKTTRVEDGGQR